MSHPDPSSVRSSCESVTREFASAQLREDQARFFLAAIVESSGDSIVTVDFKGIITTWNKAAERLYGYRADEAIGRSLTELTLPKNLNEVLASIEDVKNGRKVEIFDSLRIEKGGEHINVEVMMSPVKNDTGEVIGVSTIARDVTEGRLVQEALRQSEARFPAMLEQANVGIVQVDEAGRFLAVNPGFCRIVKRSQERLLQLRVADVTHPDDYPREEAVTRQLLRGEIPNFTIEKRFVYDDGTVCWGSMTANLVRDRAGNALYTLAIVQAIDERKRAEQALRESEERLRLLVEGARDYAMFLLDAENRITFWSRGAERVFGWTQEEAQGKFGDLIFNAESEAGAEISTALREGRSLDRRWHVRKDGTQIWLDGVLMRLDDENGQLRGFAKVGRDATDQHRAEEGLRRAHEELEQRVRDRTKELELMNDTLEDEISERQKLEREILEVVERERTRISQDLHDGVCQELTATAMMLKSHAKSLAGENSRAAELFDESAEIVNRNAGLSRDLVRGLHPVELGAGGLTSALRELAARTNETVRCHCESPRSLRLPDENIAVNLYRIAQEAVTNAVKHADASEIVICIERLGDECHLVVSDNGNRRRRGKRGGLGIQMMHYRARVSGGTLSIESKPGKGSRVICLVPLRR